MDSVSNQDNLTAAFIGRTVVVRVVGRGSFRISLPIKKFIQQVIESDSANCVLIDMLKCRSMDSTFMGVLAGLSFHIRKKSDFTLKLVNLSEKNEKSLQTLGVDRVISYSRTCTEEEQKLVSIGENKEQLMKTKPENTVEAAQTTLEAHETLVNLNPDNLVKFKSVLELLQEELNNLDKR